VFLLRDEALHTLRLTIGARIGKGIQEIEICENLAFQHSGLDGKGQCLLRCQTGVGWVGKVEDCTRKVDDGRTQHRLLLLFSTVLLFSHMSSHCPLSASELDGR
jgi:hypothetical protein